MGGKERGGGGGGEEGEGMSCINYQQTGQTEERVRGRKGGREGGSRKVGGSTVVGKEEEG